MSENMKQGASTSAKRFAPPRGGEDVPWVQIAVGDWAYWAGYWWRIAAHWAPPGDQILVNLDRPGRQALDVYALSIQRWRKA